jgi:hypothetical protein
MAPASAKATAADEPWLSLRRRHDVELRDFQRQVQEQKRTFLENVERTRATILAKHAEQEKLFWSKVNGSANNGANTLKKGVQHQANRHFTAPPPRLPGPSPTTLESAQILKPAQPEPASSTPAPQPAHRKAAVTYIDLCSDEDEPIVSQKKPALTIPTNSTLSMSKGLSSTNVDTVATHEAAINTIPSANLELFGNNSRTFRVG